MTFSLTASGVLQSVEEAETLINDFREFLAKHRARLSFSSFSSPTIQATNLHTEETAPPTPPAAAEAPPEAPPAAETDQPAAPVPAAAEEGSGEADDPPAQ